MTKKSKPASLTSSLLARKGEAEPAETPYSIAEASGQTKDSSRKEPTSTPVDDKPEVSEEAGTGNGQSMEGFGRLPLGDQDESTERTASEPESASGGFTLPEGIQAGDPPITEPVVTEPVVADPVTEPVQDTALDLSNLGSSTDQRPPEPIDTVDTNVETDKIETGASVTASEPTSDRADDADARSEADDAEKSVAAAVALEAQDAAPPPIMPNTLADEAPADTADVAAADAEREAARDARLLRFVYIMAALTGIVAIVLYAGGWFVDKDTPQVAEQTPPTETLASAGSTDPAASGGSSEDSPKPDASSEATPGGTASSDSGSSGAPATEPSATPSGSAAIPAAPPIAAPGFGESGSKPGETAITTGGKAKATATPEPKPETAPGSADKKSASGIEVETLKPPAAPTLKAPEVPTVTAKAPDSAPASEDASKSATPSSGTGDSKPSEPAQADGKQPASDQTVPGADSKVAVAAPEKATEPAAKSTADPGVKPAAADAPAETPKVPNIQPPPVLTAPKLPSAQKPDPAAKSAKKVPNLRVLAPALVRPDPPQTAPPASVAKPSATAQIPKESKTAALTPPKKPVATPSKSGGKFLIQLASVKSQKRAEAEWARLKKAFPREFGGRDLVVEKRAIAGRGTFYRVQTGRFETLKDARAMCASLKGKKQACLPVTR